MTVIDFKLVVVVPTLFLNNQQGDVRYESAKECCRMAAKHRINVIVVDASPNHDIIARELTICGTTNVSVSEDRLLDNNEGVFVQVLKQSYDGRKGAALREGISTACRQICGSAPTTSTIEQDDALVSSCYIAFQEPEKFDMIRYYHPVLRHMLQTNSDICVPSRSLLSFQSTYPIEQWHSEQFANQYLNSLSSAVNFPFLDWTMGPIVFRANLAKYWLNYPGELWDAQIVPMVRAHRWHRATLSTFEIDYQHPASMKEEESGKPEWSEKRLYQLNHLFEYVGKALREEENSGL